MPGIGQSSVAPRLESARASHTLRRSGSMDRLLRCGRVDRVMGLSLVCWWIACAVGGEVHAQGEAPSPAAEAAGVPGYAEAIGEAIEHYSAHRWPEAQAAFARAHALQPSARTYRGLGLAAFYLQEFVFAREA